VAEVVDQGTGRTKWKRFGLAFAPALAAGAALAVLVANGALAVSFAVSGTQFKVGADRLVGTEGFEQFPGIDHDADGNLYPVAVTVLGHAELTNLCQTVKIVPPISIPGVNHVILRISAGTQSGNPVEAENLVVDATALAGDATFTTMQIGRDASTLNAVSGVTGPKGFFAQQAATVTINNLEQTALATTAGTFTLPGLRLGLNVNGSECF
jgi:hypothetical protein